MWEINSFTAATRGVIHNCDIPNYILTSGGQTMTLQSVAELWPFNFGDNRIV